MSENKEKNIITLPFDEAMMLVKYAADYDSVVEYIKYKKSHNSLLSKLELASILCKDDYYVDCQKDIEIPLPKHMIVEFVTKMHSVEIARKYIQHGLSGGYIDEDVFFYIFGVEIPMKEGA